jgi:CO/xanthine dehydrogenase Mo-binding subunit
LLAIDKYRVGSRLANCLFLLQFLLVHSAKYDIGVRRSIEPKREEIEEGDAGQPHGPQDAGGGPITAAASVNAGGMAPGFSTQFCDVEVDPETGKVTILLCRRAGCPHRDPSLLCRGPDPGRGRARHRLGWALNEEYIYDKNGRLDNAGFLDYRVPVSSDMPMIEPILVEVPNPAHPYGAKGVGEVNIVPPMAAIANAIDSAIHRRLTELPMSPPKVRAALDHAGADD